jgi:hypothetical protein
MGADSLTAEFARNVYCPVYQSQFDISHNLFTNFSKLLPSSVLALLGTVLQDFLKLKYLHG